MINGILPKTNSRDRNIQRLETVGTIFGSIEDGLDKTLHVIRSRWPIVVQIDGPEPIDGLFETIPKRNLWLPV